MRKFLLGIINRFWPDNSPEPKVDRYEAFDELFTNTDAEPKLEHEMSLEDRVKRASQVRDMMLHPGFDIVEQLISYGYKHLIGSITGAKDSLEIMKIAGVIAGVSKLRSATVRVLMDGEKAKEELISRHRERGDENSATVEAGIPEAAKVTDHD